MSNRERVLIQQALLLPGEKVPSPWAYTDQAYEVEWEAESRGPWRKIRGLQKISGDSVPAPYLHKGFFDSHLHAVWMGLQAQEINLRGVKSLAEFQARLGQAAVGRYRRGYGWDEKLLGCSRLELSRFFEEIAGDSEPLLLYRVCGHAALANRRLRETWGQVEWPTLLTDAELQRLHEELPGPEVEDCRRAFLRSQAQFLEKGISAIGEMSLDESSVVALGEITLSGELTLDVQGVFDAGRAPSVESRGPLRLQSPRNSIELGRPAVFTVRHWKRFLDGSLGARSAWLSRDYADESGQRGQSLQNFSSLEQEALEALGAGFHLSFHALGDAAVDQALDLGERLQEQMRSRRHSDHITGEPWTRHRLEHVQVLRDDQLARLSAQNFWSLCLQPGHRLADESFVRSRLGTERFAQEAYRAGAVRRQQISLALGSDAPIDEYRPELVLKAACTHPTGSEALTFAEALWAFTTGARLQLGLSPGRLGPGEWALTSDPRNIL